MFAVVFLLDFKVADGDENGDGGGDEKNPDEKDSETVEDDGAAKSLDLVDAGFPHLRLDHPHLEAKPTPTSAVTALKYL